MDDKISFDEYIKEDRTVEDEGIYHRDPFDELKTEYKRDFVVPILFLIAIICLAGTILYFNKAMIPVDNFTIIDSEKLETINSQEMSEHKNGKINLNAADIETLCELKGIGESKALAIISYRKANGKFKNISEIKNVKGIGPKIFDSIKDFICI